MLQSCSWKSFNNTENLSASGGLHSPGPPTRAGSALNPLGTSIKPPPPQTKNPGSYLHETASDYLPPFSLSLSMLVLLHLSASYIENL